MLLYAGSDGEVTFTGLNPNRGHFYGLKIRGKLPNGDVVQIRRGVHLGKCFSVSLCMVTIMDIKIDVLGVGYT